MEAISLPPYDSARKFIWLAISAQMVDTLVVWTDDIPNADSAHRWSPAEHESHWRK